MSVLYVLSLVFIGMATAVPSPASTNRALFSVDLFNRIAGHDSSENVVISPLSIQTCLALVYLGSGGKTATELEDGLKLGTNNKKEVARNFATLLDSSESGNMVKIANKIYINKGYEINRDFNSLAKSSFHSEAETLNFKNSRQSEETINNWVESQTNNKIQNLLAPGTVDDDTSAIVVNAIYFKGKWDKPFSSYGTVKSSFSVSPTRTVQTDFMTDDESFKYGEFENLDAKALEMPYKDSDLSMIIILPNQTDGLGSLTRSLKTSDILELSNQMRVQKVELSIPKFKVEYSIKLNDVLKEMGMKTMFTTDADFSGLFSSGAPAVSITDVFHKAFINVDEAGSEAAAATFAKAYPMSLNFNQKKFIADHPFVWAIKDNKAIYFMGQVSQF